MYKGKAINSDLMMSQPWSTQSTIYNHVTNKLVFY